jgi:5'-nucleotidase
LTTLVLVILMLSLLPAAWAQGPFTLTILHTNDTHAHLESFEPFNQPLQGGVARRYTAIQQVRDDGGNVILVDAGDAFQGTLFFNQWQGEEESHFMNALGYQAMAVGNHEFDLGPAKLASFVQQADFPVLSANLDASADPDLGGLIEAYTVLEVGGDKVGVFGLTTPDAAFISSPGPNVVFGDAADAARATVEALEDQGINKIVALTHLGYSVDQQLAAAVDGIDVIVGGHSHTPLGDMDGAQGPYPTVVTAPAGDPVLVVSAYDWGRYLGRLDIVFNADGKVETYEGQPIFIDESVAEDAGIAADVVQYAQPLEELKNHIIGQSAVDLKGDRELVRSQETNLADMICDAMLWKSAAEDTQICIVNGGGIRASIPAGDVSMGQVLEVLPFGNQIATLGLKGSDVLAALEHGLSGYEEQAGAFPQVGGMRYTFDPSQPAGARITGVQVKGADGGYRTLDPDVVYKLTSNEYLRGGGDGYDIFVTNAIDPYDGGALLSDAVAEYIGAHSPVSPATEGRIAIGEAQLPTAGRESFAGSIAGFVVLLGATLIAVGLYLRRDPAGSPPPRDNSTEW